MGSIRRLAATVACGALLALAPAVPADAAPVASPHRFTDARADARYGMADILSVTVDNGPRLSVTVRMVNAVAFSQWGDRIQGMAVFFNPEAFMDIRRGGARFTLNGGPTICSVRREYLPVRESYVFSMARRCLRDPATIRVQVQTASLNRPTRDGDRAPRSGFSRAVAER